MVAVRRQEGYPRQQWADQAAERVPAWPVEVHFLPKNLPKDERGLTGRAALRVFLDAVCVREVAG